MNKPADYLGMSPSYRTESNSVGTWNIFVTPPAFLGAPTTCVILTHDQYLKFLQWRSGEGMIQDMLPDLSAHNRELLLTGIDSDNEENR